MFFLGNINKDLMNLRSCLEILRENQANCDGSQTGKVCITHDDHTIVHAYTICVDNCFHILDGSLQREQIDAFI